MNIFSSMQYLLSFLWPHFLLNLLLSSFYLWVFQYLVPNHFQTKYLFAENISVCSIFLFPSYVFWGKETLNFNAVKVSSLFLYFIIIIFCALLKKFIPILRSYFSPKLLLNEYTFYVLVKKSFLWCHKYIFSKNVYPSHLFLFLQYWTFCLWYW